MSIVTKKGDKGMTSLYWGGRIRKDHIRVETYGTLDELCTFLGLAKSLIKERETKKILESVQKDLFIIGSEIAAKPKYVGKLEYRIDSSYVKRLEESIKDLEERIKFEGCCFLLPGENFISATLDIARTITRRAERRIVTLKNKKIFKNPYILPYMNRLSDLLYLLARCYEKKHRKLELEHLK
ncbi:MAG: ATP:cob(I)alamin adenosyltransferase [Candidatus Schekmanbacteria bacterium RBG_16_38_11]|uniref:Corrinoid adenosyltransferase n=1 Tax=Candidatus Schekmanbacteria bacterium RBG_16_38_11 TaxID=1817880 RepID=A0A1F7RZE1_9BACT|nr:MAG: ATP:cob(I)alamin adenosyltransferase [Candidatus Schekmanbacteria bacterium RBG_16_38_11]